MAAQVPHSKTSLISLFDQHFLVLPLYFVVIMDMVISNLVAEQPVAIFSKNSCCISHTIKLLIRSFGASPTVYELDELPNGKQIERALVAMGQKPSVPVVFIGQQLVGGSNEVMSLHLKGRLVPMLIQARAIWV